jgi:hypothetical protein
MSDYSNVILLPVLAVPVGSCTWAAASSFKWRRRRARPSEPLIWAGFGLFFLACIVMKIGRTVAAVDDIARGALKQGGLYVDRRPMQIAALCVLGAVIALGIWQLPQVIARWRRYRWTIIGSLVLAGFATIRAISLHEVDDLGNAMVWIKVVVESAASFLAALGAFIRARELAAPVAAGGTND